MDNFPITGSLQVIQQPLNDLNRSLSTIDIIIRNTSEAPAEISQIIVSLEESVGSCTKSNEHIEFRNYSFFDENNGGVEDLFTVNLDLNRSTIEGQYQIINEISSSFSKENDCGLIRIKTQYPINDNGNTRIRLDIQSEKQFNSSRSSSVSTSVNVSQYDIVSVLLVFEEKAIGYAAGTLKSY